MSDYNKGAIAGITLVLTLLFVGWASWQAAAAVEAWKACAEAKK
jgi:hypothetical protein